MNSQIQQIQKQHREWCEENFGDRESQLGAVALAHPLLCMAAAGRYAHSALKADQGIRGEDGETLVAARMDNKAIAAASDHNIDPAGVAALESVDRRSLQCAIGVFEEAGELVEAVAERDEEATLDAVGDVALYLMDLCNRLDVSFDQTVAEVARRVHGRDWNEAPTSGQKGGVGVLTVPAGVTTSSGGSGVVDEELAAQLPDEDDDEGADLPEAVLAVQGFAVDSSNVLAVAWHRFDEPQFADGLEDQTDALFVAFKGGAVYTYWGVPLKRAVGLATAKSVGRYLAEHVKGVYPYEAAENTVVQWDESIAVAEAEAVDSSGIANEGKLAHYVEHSFLEWNGIVDLC